MREEVDEKNAWNDGTITHSRVHIAQVGCRRRLRDWKHECDYRKSACKYLSNPIHDRGSHFTKPDFDLTLFINVSCGLQQQWRLTPSSFVEFADESLGMCSPHNPTSLAVPMSFVPSSRHCFHSWKIISASFPTSTIFNNFDWKAIEVIGSTHLASANARQSTIQTQNMYWNCSTLPSTSLTKLRHGWRPGWSPRHGSRSHPKDPRNKSLDIWFKTPSIGSRYYLCRKYAAIREKK